MNPVTVVWIKIQSLFFQGDPAPFIEMDYGSFQMDSLFLFLIPLWVPLLCILFLVGGMFLRIYFHARQIKVRNKLLEEEIKRQAITLKEANERLISKNQNTPEKKEREKKYELRSSTQSDIPISQGARANRDEELLTKTIRIIEDHISDPELNGDKICKELGVSKSVLYAKLKNLTGQTVNEFIRTIRLKESTKRLLEGKLTITQISHEMGFNSPSYYSRSFVQYFGIPPKEYVQRVKTAVK